VPGFIEERNFTEGQQVKKGDLLFRIEQATYKAAVDQARATLAKAKATEVNAKLQFERGKELVRNQNIPQHAPHVGLIDFLGSCDFREGRISPATPASGTPRQRP
jgi:multidrug resistance efflux pump